MVEFEWDDDKQSSNKAKHGIDFLRARILFDGRPVITVATFRGEETRYATTGALDDRYSKAIWTLRGERVRIISVRKARDAEKRDHRAIHG
ncbi:BrnT family toxin [soil metagenome]